MLTMTKQERVMAALKGQQVDRVPVSCWGHNYLKEWSAGDLAEAMLSFHRKYDWDYMKVNPRSTHFAEAWGCRVQPSGDAYTSPHIVEHVVKKASDWERLEVLDLHKGPFGEQLEALGLIERGLAGSAPFVQTVFSPLSVARYLAGGSAQRVKLYMREAPESLHRGLSVIADTLAAYASACLERGASGIFFATTVWATYDELGEMEYREFGRPYDLRVLAAVQRGATFNILHICRDSNMFDLLRSYPVHAINWAATLPYNPTLRQGRERTPLAVMGGLSEATTLKEGTPGEVAREVEAALEQTGGRRLLIGPGCTIPPQVPEANLKAAIEALCRWKGR